MNIMLGDLSTMDICNRLGISLPSDVVEALESIRSHKAEFTGDYWHGFDIPFVIYCGNIDVAIKIRDIYKPYAQEMKTQLSIHYWKPKAQEEEPETKDDETTTFPAGKYYIGDPCYVFSCESWSKFCDKTDCFENGEDHPHLFSHRGHKFFGASTAHGDGTFYDSDGYRYGVDAGMLGIVPLALVELEGESIEDIEKHKLGRIHEFKEDFEVGVNELHTFLFGDIIIDTDDGGDI